MSSGKFSRSKYEADSDTVYSIRVQPETLTASIGGSANTAPAGAVTGEGSVRVGGGNRQIGIKARAVTIAWNDGAAPEDYDENSTVRIPILTKARYAAINIGAAVTYNGGTGVVVGKSPERVR